MMNTVNVSHFGLCVSNLEKSLRFYCDGLGFEKGTAYDIGNEAGRALEVEGDVVLASQFIGRDGVNIELLYFVSPRANGQPSASRNQLGLTHLSLYVDNIDAVGKKLVEHGGKAIDDTDTTIVQDDGGKLRLIFFTDPDGCRIELMQQLGASIANA